MPINATMIITELSCSTNGVYIKDPLRAIETGFKLHSLTTTSFLFAFQMKTATFLLTAFTIISIASSKQIIMTDEKPHDLLDKKSPFEGMSPDDIMIDVGGGKKVPLSRINKPHHVIKGPNRHGILHNLQNVPVEPEVKKQEEEWEAEHSQLKGPILDPSQHKPLVDAESFPEVEPAVRAQEEELEKQRIQKHAIMDPAIHRAVPDVSSFPEVNDEKKND